MGGGWVSAEIGADNFVSLTGLSRFSFSRLSQLEARKRPGFGGGVAWSDNTEYGVRSNTSNDRPGIRLSDYGINDAPPAAHYPYRCLEESNNRTIEQSANVERVSVAEYLRSSVCG